MADATMYTPVDDENLAGSACSARKKINFSLYKY